MGSHKGQMRCEKPSQQKAVLLPQPYLLQRINGTRGLGQLPRAQAFLNYGMGRDEDRTPTPVHG